MIAAIAFSAVAHRSRSRESCAAKNSARSIECSTEARAHCLAVASRVFARLRYHVDRLIRSASHGRCAGRLGPIPCARRQRSLRRRLRSRGVIMHLRSISGWFGPTLTFRGPHGMLVKVILMAVFVALGVWGTIILLKKYISRAVGRNLPTPILGGLHHHYVRF